MILKNNLFESAFVALLGATIVVFLAFFSGPATVLAQTDEGESPEYKLSEDGKTFERYLGSGETFVVPEGVESLQSMAFDRCVSLKSIALPESLTAIGNGAFWGCSSLESIAIPNAVASIGENPFNECRALTSINVAVNNANYRSIDGVLFSKDGKTLIEYPHGNSNAVYVVPDGVETIGNMAFANTDALRSLSFSDSVKTIGNKAFFSCPSLMGVALSSGVESIPEDAFILSPSLTGITVPENSSALRSIKGILFSKDGTELVKYPAGIEDERYVVPDGVKRCGHMAFSGNTRLKSLVLPEGFEQIGPFAFSETALNSIVLPDSLANFAENTFSNPTLLILANAGSAAESFAKEHGLRFQALDAKGAVHIILVVSSRPFLERVAAKELERIEDALAGTFGLTASSPLFSNFQTNMPAENYGELGKESPDVATYEVLTGADAEPGKVAQVCYNVSQNAKWEDAILVVVIAEEPKAETLEPQLDNLAIINALRTKDRRLLVVLNDFYLESAASSNVPGPKLKTQTFTPSFLPKNDSYLKRFMTEAKGEILVNSANVDEKAWLQSSVGAGIFTGTRFGSAFARFAANGCYLESELTPDGFCNLLNRELSREVLNYNLWSRDSNSKQTLTTFDYSGRRIEIVPNALNSLDDDWKADAARFAKLKKSGEFSENKANLKKEMTTVIY